MKRILAVLLCLLMCVSMLPAAAFAEAADVDYDDAEKADLSDGAKTEQHTHDLTCIQREEPGCKGGHEAYYICDECGRMFSDAEGDYEITRIPTLAPKHTKPADEKQIKRTAATCTEKGQIKYKCAVYGEDVT